MDIQPSGSAELTFGGIFNTVRNPQFSARQQKTGQFDFDQKIQLNVNGKIGNALNLGIKYDTDATFDFDNQTKLNWVGKEDQMVRSIELGNVSLASSAVIPKRFNNAALASAFAVSSATRASNSALSIFA